MFDLWWKAVLAGIMFGGWPLFVAKSGMNGSSITVFGGLMTFLFVAPFALANGITIAGTRWWIILITGSMAGIGCLAFNDMLVKTKTIEDSGAKPGLGAMFFVIMLVAQTLMPAIYHLAVSQQYSVKTIAGFAAAIAACILLSAK